MRFAWYTGRNERTIEWVVGREAFWSWKTSASHLPGAFTKPPRVFCDRRRRDVPLVVGDVVVRAVGKNFVWRRGRGR